MQVKDHPFSEALMLSARFIAANVVPASGDIATPANGDLVTLTVTCEITGVSSLAATYKVQRCFEDYAVAEGDPAVTYFVLQHMGTATRLALVANGQLLQGLWLVTPTQTSNLMRGDTTILQLLLDAMPGPVPVSAPPVQIVA